jgi:transposase InsO family protein
LWIKIGGRFFYLIIFIDEYSRYIVHHSLLTAMDADSVSLEAQTAIDRLRRDSLGLPVILSDNGSSFIAMEFRTALRETNLTQKLISPHTPEQTGMEVKGDLSLNRFHHLECGTQF